MELYFEPNLGKHVVHFSVHIVWLIINSIQPGPFWGSQRLAEQKRPPI